MKANVLRLQPNKEQELLLRILGDRASALWNVANYEYRQAFIHNQKLPTYKGQCTSLKGHPVFRSLPSDVAQEVLKKLSEAWKSVKALRQKHNKGELKNKPGLVDYRKNKDGSRPTDWVPVKHSRSYKVSRTEVTLPLPRDLRKEVGLFLLSYCGTVRFLGDAGRAEIQWDSGRGRWYFSFSVEEACKPKKRDFERVAALDLGVRVLASLSIEGKDQSLHFLGRDVLKDWDYFGREIAKRFRADVKEALANEARFQKYGRAVDYEKPRLLLGVKVSVRIERYAGGCSLRIAITDLPEGMCCPYTEKYLGWIAAEGYNRGGFDGGERFIPEFLALREQLTAMVNRYNRDRSDSQSDYFCRRFYESVDLSSELGKCERYLGMIVTEAEVAL